MKICFSVNQPKIDSLIDPRFGRSPHFLITDENKKDIKIIDNPGIQAMGGAGITAAQAVVSAGAEVVITGNLGPNAFNVLTASGLKIITGVFGISAEEALEKFKKGELKETSQANKPDHYGLNHQFSSGQGGNFGQGRNEFGRGDGFGQGQGRFRGGRELK